MSVRTKAPAFWYLKRHPYSLALAPIGLIYDLGVRLRFALTKSHHSKLPVICIGNFTVGGGGKTPLAMETARLLREQGHKPVFLTRGYGGQTTGPHLVVPAQDSAQEVGDEPLILAQIAPVVVSADRVKGASFIEAMDADVIIMDDGFQNPTLHKDLSVVVVDETTGVGNGRIFPAGPLRASLTFQLRLADMIMINGPVPEGGRGATTEIERAFKGQKLRSKLVATGDIGWLKGAHVLAMTGIARPNKFFGSLARLGALIDEIIEFPDHHNFSEKDARDVLALARQKNIDIVMTQKDEVRLPRLGERGRLLEKAYVLTVKMQIEQPQKLLAVLEKVI